MPHLAICAGSFDPPSYGHINIVTRALKVFDKVIVAVASDNAKHGLFTVKERVNMLKELFADQSCVEVDQFGGMLVDYAKLRKAHVLVRGIRSVGDYEYELQMALANRVLFPKVETVFIMTEGHLSYIRSSVIKQVMSAGGSVKDMVHPLVEASLLKKLHKGSL